MFLNKYNKKNKINYFIYELTFPKALQYGWKDYPFDYYNIWGKNAGESSYKGEPTLEMLTKEYDIIIFKHYFTVSHILEDTGAPDINSDIKRIVNYSTMI